MAFNYLDSAALNAAHHQGYQYDSQVLEDHMVARLTLGAGVDLLLTNSEQILADAIVALERVHGDGSATTVWLNIDINHVPHFVEPAISKLARAGIGLVVTQGQKSSGPSGNLLPSQLVATVRGCHRSGTMWDPLERKFVHISG